MFCPRCGNHVEKGTKYCNKCGTFVGESIKSMSTEPSLKQNNGINNPNQYPPYISPNANQNGSTINKKNNNKMVLIGVGSGVGLLAVVILMVVLLGGSKNNYYFSSSGNYSDNNGTENTETKETNTKKGKYQTAIIIDNTYNGIKISNNSDAYKLIEKDSVSQKNKCPTEIKEVEDEIIKKYNITAVNLCEMDVDFARELENVFEIIYRDYPSARGHITNLSLRNTNMLSEGGIIAAFMPAFNFATSDSSSTFPWVFKTQVLLSSQYFLNRSKLEASTKDGSESGHFPPNSTIYSPVAHELGHYLSFLAMMNYYKMDSILLINDNNIDTFYNIYSDFGEGNYSLSMINEAYENYKKDNDTSISLDEWRGTISNYALAKDNSGEYIYDETIAEAFHDVYLNNDNAKEASKYIVNVLKEKLGN